MQSDIRKTFAEILDDSATLTELLLTQGIASMIQTNQEAFNEHVKCNPQLLLQMVDKLIIVDTSLDVQDASKIPFIVIEIFNPLSETLLQMLFNDNAKALHHLLTFTKNVDLNITSCGYFSRILILLINNCEQEFIQFIETHPKYLQELAKINHNLSIQELIVKIIMIQNLKLDQKYSLLSYMLETLEEAYDILLLEAQCATFQDILENNKEVFCDWITKDPHNIETIISYSIKYELPQAVKVISLSVQSIPNRTITNWIKTVVENDILKENETLISIANPMNNNSILHVLGYYRLTIVEAIRDILNNSDQEQKQIIQKSDVLEQILNLIEIHEWNNQLQLAVAQILRTCIDDTTLQKYLFENLQIAQWIMKLAFQNDYESCMKQRVGRGYQQFFTGIIRHIVKASKESELIEIALNETAGWSQMIIEQFEPIDLIESNWLLSVDPSKQWSDKIQDRMEQFNFKMSNMMIQKYQKLSRQHDDQYDENETVQIEYTEEDPDLEDDQEEEECVDDESSDILKYLNQGDDEDIFMGRNSFGYRVAPALQQQLQKLQNQDQEKKNDNYYLSTSFWKIQEVNKERINSILQDFE